MKWAFKAACNSIHNNRQNLKESRLKEELRESNYTAYPPVLLFLFLLFSAEFGRMSRSDEEKCLIIVTGHVVAEQSVFVFNKPLPYDPAL